MTCLLTMQSSSQSTQEKKGQVWKRTHGEGKPCRSREQETEDADSDDRREQPIGRDWAKAYYQAFFWVLIDLIVELLGLIIKPFDNQTES